MSVANGYKDILVRQDTGAFKLDGLSPKGFAWLNENVTFAPVVHASVVSEVIQRMLSEGMSVEIR